MNVEQQQARQTPRQPVIPDFALLRLIGAGSYGDVWLARGVTGAFRAIKIIYRYRFDSDNAFEREFRGIQAFEPISRTQPNLVHLLHIGRNSTDGYYFYVMELADDVSGGPIADPAVYVSRTLRSVIRAAKLELSQSISTVQQLAAGLAHLHRQKLVHRDIKPSNIVFVAGIPKLGDIGLVSPPRKDSSFVGTEGYIPPEGMGQPQADLYSLGKILYELATGRDRQDFPELSTAPPSVHDGGHFRRLNAVILKACDPDPRKRFASADALASALRSLSRDTAHGATTRIGGTAAWRLWIAAMTMACAVVVVLWVLNQTKHQTASTTPTIERPTIAPAQRVNSVPGTDHGISQDARVAPIPAAIASNPPPETANVDKRDSSPAPVPTKTVTTEGAGEFLGR